MTKRCTYHERQTPMDEAKIDATRRLTKEQRLEAFNMRRERLKRDLLKTGDWTKGAANEEAWARAIQEYPPLSLEELNALEVKEKPLHAEPWSPPLVTVERKVEKLPAMETQDDIRVAFLWVLNHPALVRPGIGPNRQQYVLDLDFPGCPSKGAWTFLHLALEDRDKFRGEAMSFLGKMKPAPVGAKGEEEAVEDDLGDLEAMLDGVK